MSSLFFVALGSNLGDRLKYLSLARDELSQHFKEIEISRIYLSKAVDYTDQPDFYNQVIAYQSAMESPHQILDMLLKLEHQHGRQRSILRGPRTLDLDLIAFGDLHINDARLTLPHPRFLERSFVVRPLLELQCAQDFLKDYTIPDHFDCEATAL